MWKKILALSFFAAVALLPARADEERYREMAQSMRHALEGGGAELPPGRLFFGSAARQRQWEADMSARLKRILPANSPLQDAEMRRDFLRAAHYEASRAGLDPQLLLAVAHVESAFRKYAISSAGARGYMQIMPFWRGLIGGKQHNLFHLRTNLRYGAVILRHYLDIENGDLFRALARYNGSLGRARYPNLVFSKWRQYWRWRYTPAAAN